MLKVPEVEVPAPAPPPRDRSDDRPTFVERRASKTSRKASNISGGLVASPKFLETHWHESLLYPLQGDAGVSILVFMSVGLWFATAPLFGLIPGLLAGTGLSLFALIFLFPFVLLLGVVGGHTLGFLGQVLVTSSLGDLQQPRLPGWSLSELRSTLVRWFWALLIGVVVGGAPTLIYWINCGEVDWLDRIVILDLIIPGLAYAQMALLATLIHESPLAANPITVLMAIWRVGWSYAKPCLMTGTVLILIWVFFEVLMRIKDPLVGAVVYWMFWVFILYTSMVLLRWLGLFCQRHALALGWFPKRERDLEGI
jgi:hypothetical protein